MGQLNILIIAVANERTDKYINMYRYKIKELGAREALLGKFECLKVNN